MSLLPFTKCLCAIDRDNLTSKKLFSKQLDINLGINRYDLRFVVINDAVVLAYDVAESQLRTK